MQLASAFRFSSSLVAVLDAGDGRIVDVNAALSEVFGLPREQMLGRNTIEVGFWVNPETRAQIWARLRSEHRVCGERVVFRTHDGRQMAAQLYCELFEHDGGNFVFAVFQQIGDVADVERGSLADPGSYRSLYLGAAHGMYRSLPDGGWIDVNPALARIFGYDSPAQMLAETQGSRASALYADVEQGERIRERLERDGHVENLHAQIRRRDGSIAWISENSRAVCDEHGDGRVLFYEGSVVDVTAQLEAEARLRQSEHLYRTLVDNSHDGVFLIQRGIIRFTNEAMAQMLGYRVDELVGSEYMRLVAPESEPAQSERRRSREGGSRTAQNYDIVLLRKDGEQRVMHVNAGAVDFEGDIASTGTIRDITEEHRQKAALEHAERTYRELFQHSVAGMFRTLPDGRIMAVNDAFAHLLGFDSADELIASRRLISEFYADASRRQEVLSELARSDAALTFEFEARRHDGSRLLTEVRAQAMRAGDGTLQWIEGSARDITARRKAELALQESEARYRALVEHSQVGVYMMLEDCYTYVNQAFATMFGYSEEELIGANFRMLVPPESRQQQEHRYERRHAGSRSDASYRVTLQRKDGARIETVVSAGTIEREGRQYTTGTIRDVTEQIRVQRELEHNATHDLLTGLPNRVFFEEQLNLTIAARRSGDRSDYAVLFLDLDGFKLVNDSLGHASGDRLLVQIAETLRANLGGHCLVARYGGDEFTLLPHGDCSRARAEQLAQRVLTLLAGSFEVDGHRVFSGASLGVVLGNRDYKSPDQVLRDADTAMYRAKASGKSAYVIFDDAMHAAARARLKVETELRFALERGEFKVFYQPIVNLHDGGVQSCEALVRWQHPERGLLLPAEFLAVADETGALVALDWWVLERTCRNLLRWQRRFPRHAGLRASVNIDERQFADPGLVEKLRQLLERSGVDPATLALEITETVFRSGRQKAEATLHGLKALGVILVVDDFGTGYSSLDSFATSPFDALKIDYSFVRDMATNFRHRAIVRTIVGLSRDLGLGLIAEGVETPEQAALLLDMGCTLAQGFLYAPALPTEALELVLDAGLQAGTGPHNDAVA